jgi:uncharacterized protein YbjT (DUF2867 family)
MYIVLAATGHIGSQVVENLKASGQNVLAVTHDADKARSITGGTVKGLAVDLKDSDALTDVFRKGKRAFLLVPQASPTTDTNTEELQTAKSIVDAVDGSGLEKVMVVSTYGAQEGDAIGDLSVLWEFERLIRATGVPMAVNRGAYYFTNIKMLFDAARQTELPTPYPEDLVMPMVSPVDLANAAVARLTSGIDDVGVRYVEGPRRYSFAEGAAILSDILGRHVHLKHIPREGIKASYLEQGFSDEAAQAFTNMMLASLDQGPELPADPIRGDVTLEQHLKSTLAKQDVR